MTTTLEATDKDFEQMMQMLGGFFVTQITSAVAAYSVADHLAKGACDRGTDFQNLPNVVPSATAAASALGLADRSKALAGDSNDAGEELFIAWSRHCLMTALQGG